MVKKGDIVNYVCKIDFDLNDSIPNVCAALVAKVRSAADGKPESVALKIFTPSGGFSDEYVIEDASMSRGTWHHRG